jgi:hypothetical protein
MQKKHVPKSLGVGQDGLGSRKTKASQRVTQSLVSDLPGHLLDANPSRQVGELMLKR